MQNKRAAERRRSLLTGFLIYGPANFTVEAVVRDVSETGARLRLRTELSLAEPIHLLLIRQAKLYSVSVAWTEGRDLGVHLGEEIDLHAGESPLQRVARRLWLERVER